MDLSLSVSNREISPGVVNFFQFENETTTLTFTMDDYMFGEVDLRNYKVYAITSINGHIDMTELVTSIVDDKLVITWDVREYTLRQSGAILYQLAFKENAEDVENSAVFYSYKGVMINRNTIDADNHIVSNYPTILKQWLDRINELSGAAALSTLICVPVGESVDLIDRLAGKLYYIYDTEDVGHFEDYQGNTLTVGFTPAKYLYDIDLNDLLEHGDYICAGLLENRPQTNATYFILRVVDSPSTSRITQEVIIPQTNDDSVRMFIRSISKGTSSTTYGKWTELATGTDLAEQVEIMNAQLDKSKFETKCLKAVLNKDLQQVWIERLDTAADVTSTSTFNSELGCFELSDSNVVTSSNANHSQSSGQFWCTVDYEGDGTPNVYILDGSSSTQLTLDGLTDVTLTNQYHTLKIQASGTLKLKSFAWGLK